MLIRNFAEDVPLIALHTTSGLLQKCYFQWSYGYAVYENGIFATRENIALIRSTTLLKSIILYIFELTVFSSPEPKAHKLNL